MNAPPSVCVNATRPAFVSCCVTMEFPVTVQMLDGSTDTLVMLSAAPVQCEPERSMFAALAEPAMASPISVLSVALSCRKLACVPAFLSLASSNSWLPVTVASEMPIVMGPFWASNAIA